MSWSSTKSRLIGALLLIPILFAGSALAQDAKPFSNEQLDQLTAQIALYPDSLLAQLLMATTYPEDFAAAAAWSKAHPDAKGDDAVKMVENEPWDPSVASLVAFPEVLITLGETARLGAQHRRCVPRAARRRHELRAAASPEGAGRGQPEVERTGNGVDAGAGARAAAATQTVVVQQSAPPPQVIVIEPAQPSGGLRAVVQPDGRVRTVAVGGVPAVLLPAAARLLVVAADRHRHRLGCRHRRHQRAVGRRPLGRGLGPQQRQHQRQPLQQHQRQPTHRHQQQERELESQSGSARQHAVPWRRLRRART